jgi:1-deoxy-D-xylulose-5-phosphate synthase
MKRKIITVEDGCIEGGFGSAVLEFMSQHGYKNDIKILGIPDKIVEHGTPNELIHECNYDAAAIKKAILDWSKDSVKVTEYFQ